MTNDITLCYTYPETFILKIALQPEPIEWDELLQRKIIIKKLQSVYQEGV